MNKECLIKEYWRKVDYEEYLGYLLSIKNEKTIEFNSKIIKTNYKMIGIKTPELRNIAKFIAKGNIISFLSCVKSTYFEEILIEGFVIGFIKDYNLFLKYFEKFIRKIDNWAVCDMCVSSFKIMKKVDFFGLANNLINTNDEFIQRVGLIIILGYYIDDNHIKRILDIVQNLRSNYYYVNMASAWLISTCFVKYKEMTLEAIKSKKMPAFVQNKSIQKIRDSYKVNKKDKDDILKYKIKDE